MARWMLSLLFAPLDPLANFSLLLPVGEESHGFAEAGSGNRQTPVTLAELHSLEEEWYSTQRTVTCRCEHMWFFNPPEQPPMAQGSSSCLQFLPQVSRHDADHPNCRRPDCGRVLHRSAHAKSSLQACKRRV